jgi:hypothetical protein
MEDIYILAGNDDEKIPCRKSVRRRKDNIKIDPERINEAVDRIYLSWCRKQ